ncbi:MAG TPA: aminopeptidase [Steroidobacteraceae bacterium]|nr:aminopeptidase [Steroidobacteraceae bacterium]
MSRLSAVLLIALGLPQLAGCYAMQAARGQWSVMAKREPIQEVIARPETPATLKTSLATVLDVRRFATQELGLPDNGSYRSYADIGRAYVVWNVFATPRFSIEPRRWCFPVAGCVAYRGYFAEKGARSFAQRLEEDGLDVYVGGVAAYSTLGHFEDPVLNTMIGWSDVQLAAIIFHELSHQLLYVPGDSSFNESFASVVEGEGVRRWLRAQNREADLDAYRGQQRRYGQFVDLLIDTRQRLDQLYRSGVAEDEMQRAKEATFAQLAEDHTRLKQQWGGRSAFDRWFASGVNNAHLVSVATYEECVTGIQAVLDAAGGDLQEFYARMRAIAELDAEARRARLCVR